MKSIKSLSLLFVFGEYYLSFYLTRLLLALNLSNTVQYWIIVCTILNVSFFYAVVPCTAGVIFLPFSQEVAANLICVAVEYSVLHRLR